MIWLFYIYHILKHFLVMSYKYSITIFIYILKHLIKRIKSKLYPISIYKQESDYAVVLKMSSNEFFY